MAEREAETAGETRKGEAGSGKKEKRENQAGSDPKWTALTGRSSSCPFDALKGFQEALREKERIRVPKRSLSEEERAELDRELARIGKTDMVEAEYFQDGGICLCEGHGRRGQPAGRLAADREHADSL